MTTLKRAGRLPALILTLLVTGVAAVALTLSTGGGSTAAPAQKPHPVPAHHHRHQGHSPHATAHTTARTAARGTASDPDGPQPGDSPAQMYLDDTELRDGNLIHTWDQCLIDHGAKQTSSQPEAVPYQGAHAPLAIEDPVPASASAACQDVLPLLPKEENPNINHDYVADSNADVACLRSHGVMVHQVPDTSVWPDGLGWTYDSSTTPTPDNQAQIEHDCTIASFSFANN